jgi:hypothetical protein
MWSDIPDRSRLTGKGRAREQRSLLEWLLIYINVLQDQPSLESGQSERS